MDYMRPSEVLEKAAEVLRERGHHKGSFTDTATGAVCLAGAIAVACGLRPYQWSPWAEEPANALNDYLRALTGCGDLAMWNDDPATSAEDLQLTIKQVAHELREQGR